MAIQDAISKLKLPFEPAPKQVEICETLSEFERIGLFADVGCGKTFMSTVMAVHYGREVNIVVMPHILLRDWKRWLNTVLPEDEVCVYYGPNREFTPARWYLTSYSIFRNDFDRFVRVLGNRERTVIVDEAHNLKNPTSVLYKRVKQFSLNYPVMLLTGTPISKPDDAYAYVSIKTPSVYRSYGHFERLHVEERDHFGAIKAWRDLEKLKSNLALQAVYVSKNDIFGNVVAPPVHQVIEYDLHPDHLKLYRQLVEDQLLLLPDGEKIDATTANKLRTRLNQIVVNWDHFSGDPTKKSEALNLVDQIVEQTGCLDLNRNKLIIFANYVMTNNKLLKHFGPACVGAFSGQNSAKSVAAFEEDPNVRILNGHYLSMGVGLNPQAYTNVILFLEPSTVPLQMRQAAGRVDRMGQKDVPTMIYGCARGTIQKYLLDCLLNNDDLVAYIEDKQSLRSQLLGLT